MSVHPGKLKIRLALAVFAYLLVAIVQWIQPQFYERLDAGFIDWLSRLSPGASAPVSDAAADPVVYIDANFYYDRSYHAQVIQNLAALKTKSQFVDFVFEKNIGDENDQRLIQAVTDAGSVHLGISFESLNHPSGGPHDPAGKNTVNYMDRTKWWVGFTSPPDGFFIGHNPAMTASRVASASQGSGFLNLPADADGIVRSVPLLVRYRGALYPSFAFRAACDYLGITQADIVIDPGENVTLRGAVSSPGEPARDIVIPIDECGRMLINFKSIQPPIPHYSYRDIFRAFENSRGSARLQRELAEKIAIISENVEADVNVRPAGGFKRLTTGEVHAVVIRNILSQSFLCRLSAGTGKAIGLAILAGVFAVSLFWSSLGLIVWTVMIFGLYLAGGIFAFSGLNMIVPFAAPLFIIGTACALILIAMAAERAMMHTQTEKAKQRAEHELDIGRQIQAGFFPSVLPAAKGWEIAAYFKAARHVSGDFYDAFHLDNPRYLGMVIADVCDKGVGAALYMAIFRSLVRVLSRTSPQKHKDLPGERDVDPLCRLTGTIRTINDYVSLTHEKDGMFATIFFGILDAKTGKLSYVNGGHEPPLIMGDQGLKKRLMPTGTAVGAYPGVSFEVETIRLEPGDIFLGYTDGVIDARNRAGMSFTRERLIKRTAPSPARLIDDIKMEIEHFTGGEAVFDDITLLAVGRKVGI